MRAPRRSHAQGGRWRVARQYVVSGRAFRLCFPHAYSSAKFGIIGFASSLAKELGPHNIRVNAILPGIVEGPRMEGVIQSRAQQLNVFYDEMKKQYSLACRFAGWSVRRCRRHGRFPAVRCWAQHFGPVDRRRRQSRDPVRNHDAPRHCRIWLDRSRLPISFARSAHQVVLWDEYPAASRKALDFICGGPA